jgi:hypothetical protein
MPINSPKTAERGKQIFETELDAESWLSVCLRDGPIVLRLVLTRIQEQGYDAHRLYQREVDIRQKIMRDNHMPPLRLPTWEEVAPTR